MICWSILYNGSFPSLKRCLIYMSKQNVIWRRFDGPLCTMRAECGPNSLKYMVNQSILCWTTSIKWLDTNQSVTRSKKMDTWSFGKKKTSTLRVCLILSGTPLAFYELYYYSEEEEIKHVPVDYSKLGNWRSRALKPNTWDSLLAYCSMLLAQQQKTTIEFFSLICTRTPSIP